MQMQIPTKAGVAAILTCLLAACNAGPSPGAARPLPTARSLPSGSLPVAPSSPATSPEPAPAATIPRGQVPSGFLPLSTTWVSLSKGWVLGTAPCAAGSCLGLLRTDDAGRTWAAVTAPPAHVTPGFQSGSVHDVRFADSEDGWAFGPDLWATHDGGATWRHQVLNGSGLVLVESLEATAGRVHAAVIVFDSVGVRVYESPVNKDAWVATGVAISAGAGPVPRSLLVATEGAGWMIQVNRTVVGGARLYQGEWREWKPPCADAGGRAFLAAASATSLAAICNEGVWTNGPPATRLYLSQDGGSSFQRVGTDLPVGSTGAIASPRPGTVITGAFTADGHAILLETTDSGATWTRVYDAANRSVTLYVGFTSASQGVAILTGDLGGTLLMTFDAGRHWSPITLGTAG